MNSVDFESFNKFEFLSEACCEAVESDLKTNYVRLTSTILFRHGHRTPFKYRNENQIAHEKIENEFYSNLDMVCFHGKEDNMYKNYQLCPYSETGSNEINLQFDVNLHTDGMLTKHGSEQLRSLGKALKGRYNKEVGNITCQMVSDGVKPDIDPLLAISTRTERTIESLRSVLKGMFDDNDDKQQTSPLIKIFVFDNMEINWMLVPFRKYPELIDGLHLAHSHDFKTSAVPGYTEWVTDFSKRSEIESEDIDVQIVRDYVTCFKTFNLLDKSSCFNQYDFEQCNVLATFAVSAESIMVKSGVQMSTCRFFGSLLHLLDSRERTLTLLSGHDTTINFVRLALRAQDYSWPDFGYHIEFEVYRNNSTNQIKVLVLFNLKPVVLHAISPHALIPYPDFANFVKVNLLDF